MKKRVLVTGADGQLALTIKEQFEIHCKNLEFKFVSKDQLDITSDDQIQKHFNKFGYDYVVNCAAYTNVDEAETNPKKTDLVNAIGPKLLAQACSLIGAKLIHISTDYVFDGTKKSPYHEEDEPNPINLYGASKLKGELFIDQYLEEYYIIRTSWLYSNFGKNFLTNLIKKINNNNKLSITTEQTGTPTSCLDLAKFIFFILNATNLEYGIYHFSADGEVTWFDFARCISSRFKSYDQTKLIPVKSFETVSKRPAYSVLSNKKRLKAYNAIIPWEQSINHYLI